MTSLGLLVVVACLCCSCLVGSNPIQKDEMKKLLNDKLDIIDLSDEEAVYDLFEEWAATNDLTFADDNARMDALMNWKTNALKIKTHRREHKHGKYTYQLALNRFAHLSREEFRKRLGFKNPTPSSARSAASSTSKDKKVKRAALPTSVNWVQGGLVTAVKDQGQCGSCWTFSAAQALEGAYAKLKGVLMDFSEEEFIDCVTQYVGCDGGVSATAIEYVASKGGIATAASYPYIAQDGVTYNPSCEFSTAVKIPMTPTYTWLDDDISIQTAVANQPVSVAISVGNGFDFYDSGIMDPSSTCDVNVNHGVLIVGYGVDSATNTPYWLFKNSWSADWGEQGYFRMSRAAPNACLITVEALKVDITVP